MNEYNEGDLVEAVRGETLIRGRVTLDVAGNAWVCGTGTSVGYYENNGFTLTTIEKASPNLPTEPGAYVAENWTSIVTLNSSGRWHDDYGNCLTLGDSSGTRWSGKLTRLEPVPVTAKKVIDRVVNYYHGNPRMFLKDILPLVADEFGVTR